jgi:hypothetical protein
MASQGATPRDRSARAQYFKDVVATVRSSRAAVQRREPRLAIHMLTVAAFEVGVARNRFGSNAATEALRRSVCRMERVVVEAFAAGAS